MGTYEVKEKADKVFRDLIFKIPFYKEEKFYLLENSKKEKENSPDYIIMFGKEKAGGAWTKQNNSKHMLTGTIFCLGFPENRLYFTVFLSDDCKNGDIVIGEGKT